MRLGIPDKLSLVLLAWTCAFVLPWQYHVPFIFLLVLAPFVLATFRPVSDSSRSYFVRFLRYSLLFAFVLVVANGLLVHQGRVRFHFASLDFYELGIEYGLTVSLRLILLSLSVLVLFTSLKFADFAEYLRSVGLPQSLVSIILLTLFFLEQLPERISKVFTAQEARGAPVRTGVFSRGRTFFMVLSPLILSSIVESVERGIALELRGYRQSRRTVEVTDARATSHFWGYGFIALSITIILLSLIRWHSK